MRHVFAGAIAVAALLFATPQAVAQRDAADRGQRLESDAFRNDMEQERLKKPVPPPNWQAAPSSPDDKPKRSDRKRRSN